MDCLMDLIAKLIIIYNLQESVEKLETVLKKTDEGFCYDQAMYIFLCEDTENCLIYSLSFYTQIENVEMNAEKVRVNTLSLKRIVHDKRAELSEDEKYLIFYQYQRVLIKRVYEEVIFNPEILSEHKDEIVDYAFIELKLINNQENVDEIGLISSFFSNLTSLIRKIERILSQSHSSVVILDDLLKGLRNENMCKWFNAIEDAISYGKALVDSKYSKNKYIGLIKNFFHDQELSGILPMSFELVKDIEKLFPGYLDYKYMNLENLNSMLCHSD